MNVQIEPVRHNTARMDQSEILRLCLAAALDVSPDMVTSDAVILDDDAYGEDDG